MRGDQGSVAAADDPEAVANDDIFCSHFQEKASNGEACRTAAVDYDAYVIQFSAGAFQCVQKGSGYNNRRTVLIVMENGDVANFFEFFSISKQRGAAMSSRFIPPKLFEMRATV